MKKCFFYLWGFILLPLAAESSPAQKVALDRLTPIDRLRITQTEIILPSKTRAIKKAFEALEKSQFTKAADLAKQAQNTNSVYSDYGYWITAAALRGQAQAALAKKQYANTLKFAQKSIFQLLQIEGTNPYSPFVKSLPKDLARSEWLIGDAYAGMRQWPRAQSYFEKAFLRLQASNLLNLLPTASVEHYAESCQKKQNSFCLGWIQKLAAHYTKKSNESKAIAKYFPSIPDRARYSRIPEKMPISYRAPDLDQVAFEAAMKLYLDQSHEKAAAAFKQFLEDYPRSAHRFRAEYWLGESLNQSGEPTKAQEVFTQLLNETPLSYYGLLASQASGKPIDEFIAGKLPLAVDNEPSLYPLETFRFRRAKAFLSENAPELASIELKDLKGGLESLSSPFLVYLTLLNERSRNHRSNFVILGELLQRGYEGIISPYGLRLIFPEGYSNIISKYSEANNLDPILVTSLVKQESAFDAEACSSSGALGLMQLMPATAVDTDPAVGVSSLLEVDSNVRIGTRYLRQLLTRFNGNKVLAIAAYNAGPNAVDRWIKEFSSKSANLGMLEFVDMIPYKETREYVGAIIRNYYWYSRKMNSAAPLPSSFFNNFWNGIKEKNSSLLKRRNGNA